MRYLIKAQRDGWYFTGFERTTGPACFGKIQEAKIYNDKFAALKDLRKMEQCGQRIIAVTRIGRNSLKINRDS